MSVEVIIVNWNGGELLRLCLEALSKQTLKPERIIVVDNKSADTSADDASEVAGVSVLRMETNLGFAAGNNRALEQVNAEFVALLNPDAFPEPGWLEKLVAAAQGAPEVAAFGSRQMIHDRNGLVDGLGDVYHLSGLVWRRGHGHSLRTSDMFSIEIFSPCAGAALYRTELVREAGGFDEDYFCYVEDVDLGFRMRLAGYRAMVVPEAVVQHVGSATTGGQHSDFAVYHGHRNLVWTYVKNMPGWLFWACLPLHLGMNIVTVLHLILRGQGSVILRAKRDALMELPRVWRKRRRIQRQRRASVQAIWRILDKRIWRTHESA